MNHAVLSIDSILTANRIKNLKSTEKIPALQEMVDLISTSDLIEDPKALFEAVLAREEIMSTGIGIGIAVPHVKIPSVKGFVMAMGKKVEGVEFDSLDGKPVKLLVMIAAPEGEQDSYLRLLARIVAVFKNENFLDRVLKASTPEEIISLFKDK